MLARTTKEWLAAMDEAGVPAGPINRIDQAFAEPQALARRMTAPVARDDAAGAAMVVHPVKYSATPAIADLPPPHLGAHTDEILAAFAGEDELRSLKARGIVG